MMPFPECRFQKYTNCYVRKKNVITNSLRGCYVEPVKQDFFIGHLICKEGAILSAFPRIIDSGAHSRQGFFWLQDRENQSWKMQL